MPQRKLPIRMCLGCQINRPKKELIRVVKNNNGEFFIDFTGKMNGRGAYICPDVNCFNKARKGKRFEKAFSSPIPDEIYDKLFAELSKNEQ